MGTRRDSSGVSRSATATSSSSSATVATDGIPWELTMVDRRSLAIGLLAVLGAMSQVMATGAQGQGAAAPQGRGDQGAGAQGPGGQGRGGGRGAQGPGAPGRGARGTAFTPDAGAKDLKSVLYNWTWH